MSGGVARNRNSKPIIHGVLELLFASQRTVRLSAQKRDQVETEVFQFAPTAMAKPGASATQVVRCQIVQASLSCAPLHNGPDYIGSEQRDSAREGECRRA
jgi:hypothetical protein